MASRTKASACLVFATAAAAFVWWWRLRHVQVPVDTPWLEEELHSVAFDRLLATTVVGIALGVGGLLLRTATANPLADPSITGVNSGAALGAVATAMFFGSETSSVDQLPGALLGAGIAVGVTVGVGKSGAIQRMVLVGVAVSALCSALTSIFLVIDEAQLATVMSWLSGRLAGVRLSDIMPALVAVLVVVPLTLVGAQTLDLLVAGDAVAGAVGAKPERIRLAAIVAAVVLIAPSVAATGPIGFLGLMAATVAWRVCGPHHRMGLCVAGIVGAAVLLAADSVGQAIWAPAETPVGIVTSLAGMPLVLWSVHALGRRKHAA